MKPIELLDEMSSADKQVHLGRKCCVTTNVCSAGLVVEGCSWAVVRTQGTTTAPQPENFVFQN